MERKICSNTAPLWHLGRLKERYPKIKSLELLKAIYSKIYVPSAVVSELGIEFESGEIKVLGHRTPKPSLEFIIHDAEIRKVKNQELVGSKNYEEIIFSNSLS